MGNDPTACLRLFPGGLHLFTVITVKAVALDNGRINVFPEKHLLEC